jgi:hypothetical protein
VTAGGVMPLQKTPTVSISAGSVSGWEGAVAGRMAGDRPPDPATAMDAVR